MYCMKEFYHQNKPKYYISDLGNFIKKFSDKTIPIIIPNPGNGGDAIIFTGTLHFFEQSNILYEIGDINVKYTDKKLIYGGGGNLVTLYNNAKKFILGNMCDNDILILPHTVNDIDMIKKITNRVTIITRE